MDTQNAPLNVATATADTAEVTVDRQLLKVMRWWDGLALGMTVPASIFGVIGYAVGVLGAWGACALYAIASTIGFLQSWIYSEVAAMFPDKPGGIGLYAHEGWRSRFNFIGPLAAFGYWFAWSSVLAIYGLIIGDLIQAQWFPRSTWTFYDGAVHVGLPHLIAIGVIVLVWLFNVYGIRPALWVQYSVGLLLLFPFAVFTFVPFLTSNWHSSNVSWLISTSMPWAGWKVVLVWLYVMGWTVYSSEMCASFAPEYKNTQKDTARSLKATAVFILVMFAFMPVGLTGIVGTKAVTASPLTIYIAGFDKVLGGGSGFMVALIVLGLFLVMNGSTADGSRALYGLARDRMTIRQLHHLNRHHVPGRAMTCDLVVNTLLVLFVGNVLAILVAGNLGYIGTHVWALSGFLWLRKDRPRWPRPIRVGKVWLYLAGLLIVVNVVFIAVGASSPSLTGYGTMTDTVIGICVLLVSILLFALRHFLQDKQGFGSFLRDKNVETEPPAERDVPTSVPSIAGVAMTDGT
jgi:amino acid transporter